MKIELVDVEEKQNRGKFYLCLAKAFLCVAEMDIGVFVWTVYF